MGHLTRIANHLVDNNEKSPNSERIKELIQEQPTESRERWESFVSGNLAELNKQNTVELVSKKPTNIYLWKYIFYYVGVILWSFYQLLNVDIFKIYHVPAC